MSNLALIENQATINIGMIGSVSNGKSSLTYRLTGVKTQKHSAEQKNNITMKLGYANSKIYKCAECSPPMCYQPYSSTIQTVNCKYCSKEMILQTHVSLIDCPGHHQLMATMLNGTCVMDSTILVESVSNAEFPSQQTIEHLQAIEIINLPTPITCLNKIDTISKDICISKVDILKDFMKTKNTNIIPISANLDINTNVVCQYICEIIAKNNIPKDYNASLKMIVIRSFNVNKQEATLQELQGGVIGGSIVRGTLRLGDEVIILPGILHKNDEISMKRWSYTPLISTVESINSEKNSLQYAVSGGLIGVGLLLDPSLTAQDNLVGSVIKMKEDISYKIYERIKVNMKFIEKYNNLELVKNEIIAINHNAINISGTISNITTNKKTNKKVYEIILEKPICVELKECITISKKFSSNNFEIMALGKIINGIESNNYSM